MKVFLGFFPSLFLYLFRVLLIAIIIVFQLARSALLYCMLIFYLITNVPCSIFNGLFQAISYKLILLDGCLDKVCKLYVTLRDPAALPFPLSSHLFQWPIPNTDPKLGSTYTNT